MLDLKMTLMKELDVNSTIVSAANAIKISKVSLFDHRNLMKALIAVNQHHAESEMSR
jgi:hypothetical protein